MTDHKDLELLIRAKTPLIVIESHEERRVVKLFSELAERLRLPVSRWSVVEGLRRLEHGFDTQKFNVQPTEVLRHIKSSNLPGIYLMLDFHPYLEEPVHLRLIREIAQDFTKTPTYLVFLSPKIDIPVELQRLSAKFALALPNKSRILDIIKGVAQEWMRENPGRKVIADKKAVDMLAGNLLGLSVADVRRLARKAVFDDGAITHSDLRMVMEAKYQLLSHGGVLTFEYETAAFSDVGGLDNLKNWLQMRKPAFQGGGERYGLQAPKGVMLLGVQGCGKSLAAKAVAGVWNAPLLRLDFGSLYDKYMGETEKNLRESLKTAEIMAPCILWIDEIEKGLASGSGDDGVSRRVLGTLLTWMSEKEAPCFLVATANDVTALPPELLRKGRFDEIFFVDLPPAAARAAVFRVQLKKRKLDPANYDLKALVEASKGFSGAEIEQAVVSSLYAAMAANRPPTTAHLIEEMTRTRPLSVVMAEQIHQLRTWAAARTVAAH